MSLSFQCFINGDGIEFDDFDEDWTLAHALRERLHLTGNKLACGTGGCGSCTVLVSKLDQASKTVRHFTANACITPIFSVHGCHILTIEGLSGSENQIVHPIQDAIARGNGTQCGFCTPGMVLSMFGLSVQNKDTNFSVGQIKNTLQGNLCRCTGYRSILEAFKNCSKNCSSPCTETVCDIEDQKLCQSSEMQYLQYPHVEGIRDVSTKDQDDKKIKEIEDLLIEYSKTTGKYQEVEFVGTCLVWLTPKSVHELFQVLEDYPEAKLVAGCTSEQLRSDNLTNLSDISNVLVDITSLKELREVEFTDSHLSLGAALTIAEMEETIQNLIEKLPDEHSRSLKCLLKMIKTFGSQQVRNVATIGGSMKWESSSSDLQTVAEGLGITTKFLEVEKSEEDPANKIVLSKVIIPFSTKDEFIWYEKVSRRKDCDSAIMNVLMKFTRKADCANEIRLTIGGMAVNRFTLKFKMTEENEKTLLTEKVQGEINLGVETAVKANIIINSNFDILYIQSLARSLVTKFVVWLKEETGLTEKLSPPMDYEFKSSQLYKMSEEGFPSSNDLVHKPIPHASAYKHATGEAKFCDDTPKFTNELELAFVLSTRAHAKILKVDYSKALEVEGVVGYVSHSDLAPEKNKFGLVIKDEEIFASETVLCVGQIIAGILANDRSCAKRAAKLVQVDYEDLSPVILTNEDAIDNDSYYTGYGMTLERGDCNNVFEKSPNIISGDLKIGSQEHFYMETQGCIAIPKGEDNEMEIISSTQNPTGIQMEVSNVLSLNSCQITVKVKRVGGGFGGKESRCILIALCTAIAANKFGRSIRCILDRETDMQVTGKRHPFLTQHKIAFNEEGHLDALQMKIYANAGHSLDVSMAPIERVLLNLDNAYNLKNINLEGFVCKTNIPSNTVFRGTGGPQAALLIENIMDTIASTLNKDPIEIRGMHLYKEGDATPYGQPLVNCTVQKCWEECLKLSNYYLRKTEIEDFNGKSEYRKLGIAMTPCHFGIGYTALHLNQGAALVHIYVDGSVLISHSGVEIGQGVNTKMIQVATRELGISASKIRILETSTDKVPNSTPSSASVTSDMNGMAVINACKTLVERLQPYWTENPDAAWEDLVLKAYMDRVSLSATGFYKVPDMGWDSILKQGSPWNYFSTGTACSVVEVDCLTGQFQILRTDIVMDVGQSLNPSIDIGQIEGAFIQGVGLFVLEDLIVNNLGELVTSGPSSYKIPTAGDTPLEFNVSLLAGSSNPKAIYSSKTVGEPPLLLATSVFFAIKDAIRSYRVSKGKGAVFHMDSPATVQRILMSCQE